MGTEGRDLVPVPSPLPHTHPCGPGQSLLTGMVWLPCRAWMAAWASVWEENFTKAQPDPRERECVRGNGAFLGGQGPQERGQEALDSWSDSQNRETASHLFRQTAGQ